MRELVLGGSGSGKSEYAESLLKGKKQLYYLATMRPFGKEAAQRVQRHQELRKGKGFETLEQYTDIGGVVLPKEANVLLECMGNLVANEYFELGSGAEERILCGIEKLQKNCENLVIVSNDVFCDGKAYDEDTLEYIRCLGKVNCELARRFGGVTEVVAGIGVKYVAASS